jgi:hypothetical protein
MKNLFLILCLATMFMVHLNPISAQSDKEIVKSSRELLDKKDYEASFNQIITLKSKKNKKATEILKKAYPGVIAKNNKKATAVKILDKEDSKSKCEKLQTIVDSYSANLAVDDQLKDFATPEIYKSLSKRKLIDKNVTNNTNALNKVKDDITKKEEQIRKDSIAKVEALRLEEEAKQKRIADSIAAIKKETPVAVNSSTGGVRFYIIAGSYKQDEDSQAAVSRLKSQGYPSQMVNKNAYGNMRVSYNSFEKKEEAQKELERIRKKLQPDAWILEK